MAHMLQLPAVGETATNPRPRTFSAENGNPHETELNVGEAAQRLGLDRSTISRAVNRGDLAGVKRPGTKGEQWMIPVSELERYARQRTPTAPEPSLPATMPDPIVGQLLNSLERFFAENSQQRLQITEGESRLATEREQRARLEEQQIAAEARHLAEITSEKAEKTRIQVEKDQAVAYIAELNAWAEANKRRRWRKPLPPPAIPYR
jgi:excisionase family DNA binding protein